MPNYRRIRRLGPEPQSFTRGQLQQQKPVGSCLTFQQQFGSNREPQRESQCQPQHLRPSGGSLQQRLEQPQHLRPSGGSLQQHFEQPQHLHSPGDPAQFRFQPQQ